ncbi:MAG: tetraacyldisaccharide 4'-kinase [Alphaproteobacteria bacterium]
MFFIKTPKFWQKKGILSGFLYPFSLVYENFFLWRQNYTKPHKVPVPVICVGNIVLGGSGKTPTVIALVNVLKKQGHIPHILSRGYGTQIKKDVIYVNPEKHSYLHVGDEPLILSRFAPTWVSPNRLLAAYKAISNGATILVMDDGLQNTSIYKDFNFVVVDSDQGFGNKQVFPAGPLRESISRGLKRAHAIVIIGDKNPTEEYNLQLPILRAQLICDNPPIALKPVIAFAGLGYPEKFKITLENYRYKIQKFISFADHYPYTVMDAERMINLANKNNAELITTEKDFMRIPVNYRSQIKSFPIRLHFDNKEMTNSIFTKHFSIAQINQSITST